MTGRTGAGPGTTASPGQLGLWLFLSTEVMMFGALLLAITLARLGRSGAAPFDKGLGAANTAILLTSSLLVAVAVERSGPCSGPGRARLPLAGAAALGVAFLAVKAVEYRADFAKGLVPGPDLFVNLYYVATALHAVHLTIGVALLAGLALVRPQPSTVEAAGLYWHFVDLVWVFLYPALYLVPG
ncbi:cytochrome c oxidase subunit 3 [Azospirillum doebereinerae]|uniref:cytochrome c oxidase subunit 3 n=1 Tax=Azospirillum doebereinerae TaxID=92933 RepID=UPI001EE5B017|nr:cytochrome c oxidase subunit 3 [Azospirillum doebereinerae]MCG5239723.1 cytochrome c oxidase subunit 3 [Azospirillum doebereinerae]